MHNLKVGKWMEMYIYVPFGTYVAMQDGTNPDIQYYRVYPQGDYEYYQYLEPMKAPTSGYKQVKIKSGENKGYYKWVLK